LSRKKVHYGCPRLIAGRFRIEGEIGTGEWNGLPGVHLGLERPVAIKIIKREFAADPDVPTASCASQDHGPAKTYARGNDFLMREPAGWTALHHYGVRPWCHPF